MLNGLAFGNYTCKTFLFEGRDCIIVFPDTSDENRKLSIGLPFQIQKKHS